MIINYTELNSLWQDLKWMCNSMRGDQSEHCEDLASKFGEPVYAVGIKWSEHRRNWGGGEGADAPPLISS